MRHCLTCRHEPNWTQGDDDLLYGTCRYPLPIPVQQTCITREGDEVYVWDMVRMRARVRVIHDCPVWEPRE